MESGEIVCLLGASGSGKSTLLRLIAGLIPLQQGTVQIGELAPARPNHEPAAEERRCGLVFQDHVLFPHMTVSENVAFGLHRLAAKKRQQLAEAKLREVGMEQYGRRYPHELSGGEQQRVALARALAPEPTVMLMDEPFANVDPSLRRRLREDTRLALHSNHVPCIVVTHDPLEAMELGDRIAVLHEHQIVQDDKPEEVWRRPVNQFVAELMGDTNAISGNGTPLGIQTKFGLLKVDDARVEQGTPYKVVVRPDSIRILPTQSGSVQVSDIRFLGDRFVVTLRVDNESLRTTQLEAPNFAIGAPVTVEFEPAGATVFSVFDNDTH